MDSAVVVVVVDLIDWWMDGWLVGEKAVRGTNCGVGEEGNIGTWFEWINGGIDGRTDGRMDNIYYYS